MMFGGLTLVSVILSRIPTHERVDRGLPRGRQERLAPPPQDSDESRWDVAQPERLQTCARKAWTLASSLLAAELDAGLSTRELFLSAMSDPRYTPWATPGFESAAFALLEHELEKKMGPADGAEALNPMELRLAAELAAGAWRPSQAGEQLERAAQAAGTWDAQDAHGVLCVALACVALLLQSDAAGHADTVSPEGGAWDLEGARYDCTEQVMQEIVAPLEWQLPEEASGLPQALRGVLEDLARQREEEQEQEQEGGLHLYNGLTEEMRGAYSDSVDMDLEMRSA